jgi:hypothetical protein
VVTRVEVRQESTQTGIPAKITKIAANETSEFFTETDDSGVVAPHKTCGPDDRISAEPVIPNFLKVQPKQCAAVIVFTVSSAQTAYALAVLGSDAMKAGQYKLAQAYYSSASERLSTTSPGDALVFKNQAYIAVGRSLGISQPTVNVNGEEVPTQALQKEIEKVQQEHKIAPTGNLNTKTALSFDSIDENELLKASAKVNPALLERQRIDPIKSQLGLPHNTSAQTYGVPRYDLNGLITIQKGQPPIRVDGQKTD